LVIYAWLVGILVAIESRELARICIVFCKKYERRIAV
jgi:hypothetical protein